MRRLGKVTRLNRSWILAMLSVVMLAFMPALAVEIANPNATSTDQFLITSISVEGTNLVLSVLIPPGLGRVALESRVAPDGAWERIGFLDLQPGTNSGVFTIPKPSTAIAFFRLNAA